MPSTQTPGRKTKSQSTQKTTALYSSDPRKIIDRTKMAAAFKKEKRKRQKAKFDKEEGKDLLFLKRWERELGRMEIGGVGGEVDGDSTAEWLSVTNEEEQSMEQSISPTPSTISSNNNNETSPTTASEYTTWLQNAQDCEKEALNFLDPRSTVLENLKNSNAAGHGSTPEKIAERKR